jgi:hypothetical protein
VTERFVHYTDALIMYVIIFFFHCAFVPLYSTTLYYITPLLTSPVWVLSMDKSHLFYYKYKHRIDCGGCRNKVRLTHSPYFAISLRLHLPPHSQSMHHPCLTWAPWTPGKQEQESNHLHQRRLHGWWWGGCALASHAPPTYTAGNILKSCCRRYMDTCLL